MHPLSNDHRCYHCEQSLEDCVPLQGKDHYQRCCADIYGSLEYDVLSAITDRDHDLHDHLSKRYVILPAEDLRAEIADLKAIAAANARQIADLVREAARGYELERIAEMLIIRVARLENPNQVHLAHTPSRILHSASLDEMRKFSKNLSTWEDPLLLLITNWFSDAMQAEDSLILPVGMFTTPTKGSAGPSGAHASSATSGSVPTDATIEMRALRLGEDSDEDNADAKGDNEEEDDTMAGTTPRGGQGITTASRQTSSDQLPSSLSQSASSLRSASQVRQSNTGHTSKHERSRSPHPSGSRAASTHVSRPSSVNAPLEDRTK